MRFFLDQNQPPALARLLIDAGHDSIHADDVGMAAAGDVEILRRAATDGRVLISADTDFGELLARSGAKSPSVLLLRRQQQRRAAALFELIEANLPAIADDLEAGAIAVFDETRIRVRSLPITA